MSDLGERTVGSTVVLFFTTAVDGLPTTLAGTPAISIYKNSTTESTTGVTLTASYDSRTGMNQVVVDTSADSTFYAAGNDFTVVITAGTVNSISVVGSVVGSFSLTTRQTNVDKTLNAVARGTVTTGGTTTSVPTSALSIAGAAASGVVADQFKNRAILFDGNTTTAGLKGAAATISASSASNTPTLTVGTLPATPASGDTFSIV